MTDLRETPTVYVIAGPNGADKTTFASDYLPDFVQCRHFLNADLIAAGLSPFAPETQNFRAGRLLLERINELTRAREVFSFETTLSGRCYVRTLNAMRQSGYRVELFFLWLSSAQKALERVANRVHQGGHGIPEIDIRRRWAAGLQNLFRLYRPCIDVLRIFDATRLPPRLIAKEELGVVTVAQAHLFNRIRRQIEDDSR